MSETAQVIIALLGAVGSIVGVVLTNNKSNREFDAKMDKTQAVFEAHVTEQINGVKADVHRLEVAQNKHNAVIDRTYAIEKSLELQGAELKRHGERIKILEGGK